MAVETVASTTPAIPSTTIDRTTNPAPTSTSTSSSTATTDAKSASLNYDSFLKLLVAQMKNQDPTDPVDASEQMSQLATFSSVEQAIKTNSHLESLIRETSMSQAASLLGKTVTSADGVTTGVIKSVSINSDGLSATLESGKTILIQSGISIQATSADPAVDPDPTPTPDADDGENESVAGE